jgi:hypothetical protein
VEYLEYEQKVQLPLYSFEEIIDNHKEISYDLATKFDKKDFENYLCY